MGSKGRTSISILNNKPRVSLVLGSGGARGLAHIGVIHELKSREITIASVSGCSIGSLIGGVYAAGKLDEFEHWVRAITRMDMVNLLDLSWARHGLVKGDKIIGTLVELVGDQLIEDLPIPYTAMAADIQHEKEVWLNSGRLFDAIRASISLPLFFTPVAHKDSYLIDGGVLNPVPIAPTFGDDTDLTIAVNLGGRAVTRPVETGKSESESVNDKSLRGRVERFVRELQTSDEKNGSDTLGAYAIADQAFDAMQSTIARHKLAAYPPDIIIEIARNACGTFDFDRAAEIIELGRVTAAECLDKHSG
jgi:NTE family protein